MATTHMAIHDCNLPQVDHHKVIKARSHGNLCNSLNWKFSKEYWWPCYELLQLLKKRSNFDKKDSENLAYLCDTNSYFTWCSTLKQLSTAPL